ncbi:hypothetical protein PInf_015351 [Phytophthora infestans]|nr:hypothetical protein PInf_015351 [Phytophthora infestans]
MQQRLHPDFKNPEKSLNAVVKMLYKEKEMSEDAITVFVSSVNEAVKTRLRTLMEKVVDPVASDMVRRQHSAEDDPPLISGIRARFGNRATQRPFPTQPDRVSQELRNWEIDQTEMRANEDVLAFWMRMEHSGGYTFVDIAQCESIPDDELDSHIPQCVSYVMEATPRDDEDEMILDLFSQASVEEEEKGV